MAAELLADNRFEDTGISQIAVLAESSVGTFYRLLGDKDVLLYAVHERIVEQGRSAIDSLMQDLGQRELPLSGQIEAFIRGIIEMFEGREGLLRALVRRSSTDLQFRQRFHQLNAYMGQTLCQLVLARRNELRHPQPQQAADLAAHMLLASLNYLTMVGTLGETPREVIPEELSRLICNYLEVAKH
ncbi:TetR/AcrR family transcriptional regulator [Pseudomonas aeruginosa]|uniref:TetR/AcrR family transcriptional regulator n=1 Tax=Pseudomonas aeruginosa TaxID=287 RepID=UPI0015812F60|nr:TetR/AcrR family transcriptional regulator [Pseudomonas aeruginosa]MBP8437935.1 TetR/AcrR family transcriptional regulator [Pseudomonas aeruginosa]MBP8443191.1 TetR/AcrR family transcriptional regulator [Pseudomonas aeruginosa]MBP8469750.1 TetR/AcrR family transcriptional regulator [Pseudomonas aeruginosa]MBP8480114.1 TetR/AcrR family transcriptional regulator [Pseudomonas aeruginosa]MBP8526647.1 TetR/AcrR family transcriptional regulator [Pseudomonas aeruginosa]